MISPGASLGIDEFAYLYANEGATPMEAASNIHVNYPTQAKSVLADRWRALGINESPEQYFSRPGNRRTPLARGPMAAAAPQLAPVANEDMHRRPTFNSEAERNAAIATGAFDPEFDSPAQKINYTALKTIELQDRAKIRQAAGQLIPMPTGAEATPQALLRAQLGGDTIGLAKKILIKNSTGMTPDEYYTSMDPQAIEKDPRLKPLTPYMSPAGAGPFQGTSMPSRLDTRIYYDPDFQEALNKNPEEALNTYSRLTGRSLEADLKEAQDLRSTQIKSARNFATSAIAEGAQHDPITGQWKVWGTGAPSGSSLSDRPVRQLMPATPEQQRMLDQQYEATQGMPLQKMSPSEKAHRESITRVMGNAEDYQAEVGKFRQMFGREPSTQELAIIARSVARARNAPSGVAAGATKLKEYFRGPASAEENAAAAILREQFAPNAISPEQMIMQGAKEATIPGYEFIPNSYRK